MKVARVARVASKNWILARRVEIVAPGGHAKDAVHDSPMCQLISLFGPNLLAATLGIRGAGTEFFRKAMAESEKSCQRCPH